MAMTRMDSQPNQRLSFAELLASRPIGFHQLILVALLLLVLVIDGIDIQLLSLVAPVILDEWSVDKADFGPALAGALIGMSAGSLIGGALGDRFGRRRVLILSVVGFGIATVLAGTTQGVAGMAVLRIISGIGFGAAAPNAVALANEWLPEGVRARATSLLSIGTPAGGMIGASLALSVLPVWGWRGSFYACGILTLAVTIGIILLVRESPAFLAATGNARQAQKNAQQIMGNIGTAQLRFDNVGDTPGGGRGGFLSRAYLRLNLGAGLAFFVIAYVSYALVAWTAIMLTSLGFSMAQALVAVFAFNLAAVGAAVATGFVLGTLGSRATLAGSSTLLLLVIGLLAWQLNASAQSGTALAVQILTGCAGGFAGAAMATIYSMMAAGYDVACRSAGLGFGMTLGRAGGILASLVGGYLLELRQSDPIPFLAALALAATMGIGCAFLSDRHIPQQAKSIAPAAGQ
ncbi:MFS transporter [Altererythrobacter xixiisoli]|uniref:MFS transporter n=1 Tax=Croceibacterium xixiisoli TaxID=1476466 RepID=A0A6I4TSS6_9SPHN|nr:MFS transporter [Croceibacterium xixiisoli]MXO98230.1 MFS transporter [Croceibacterium xixiisoli]